MILLVNPPAPTVPADTLDVPLGLAYVAASLQQAHFEVTALDLAECDQPTAERRLVSIVDELPPQLLGVTAVSATFESANGLLAKIRQSYPEVTRVIGGVHVTLNGPSLLSSGSCAAEVLVMREGEDTMVEIARRRELGEGLGGVLGTATISSDGSVVLGGDRPWIKDLDSVPIPARDLFGRSDPVVRVLTSRGCPYGCNFCASSALWDRYIRFHSPRRVEQEIRELVRDGADHVLIVDDTFTIHEPRALDILHRLETVPVTLSCLSRVDRINDQMVQAMVRAGVKTVSLGCESGDDTCLKAMNKGISSADIRLAIATSRKHGLRLRTSWMWGLPFDSLMSLQRTVDLILETEPDEVVLYRFVPFPGTELHMAYPELKDMSATEFFTGQDRFIVAIPGIPLVEMEEAFKDALESLRNAGYQDPNDVGPSERTVSTGFARFASFWPSHGKPEQGT